jgi:hypothetical protein
VSSIGRFEELGIEHCKIAARGLPAPTGSGPPMTEGAQLAEAAGSPEEAHAPLLQERSRKPVDAQSLDSLRHRAAGGRDDRPRCRQLTASQEVELARPIERRDMDAKQHMVETPTCAWSILDRQGLHSAAA